MWNAILGLFGSILSWFHGLFEPLTGVHAWGWAIIAMTLLVRLILLPLAVKQTRSMRAMQALQPKVHALREKYPVSRELAVSDPGEYKRRTTALNMETMALYRQEDVNPASGCLPLLLQLPVFIALFSVLRGYPALQNAPFYFFTAHLSPEAGGPVGLGTATRDAGWPGWLLLALMAGTTYLAQRQSMARTTEVPGPALAQQKVMLYAMPAMLVFVSLGIPIGVMLYWVTTNLWQMGQQAISLREVETHPGTPDDPRHGHPLPPQAQKAPPGKQASPRPRSKKHR